MSESLTEFSYELLVILSIILVAISISYLVTSYFAGDVVNFMVHPLHSNLSISSVIQLSTFKKDILYQMCFETSDINSSLANQPTSYEHLKIIR